MGFWLVPGAALESAAPLAVHSPSHPLHKVQCVSGWSQVKPVRIYIGLSACCKLPTILPAPLGETGLKGVRKRRQHDAGKAHLLHDEVPGRPEHSYSLHRCLHLQSAPPCHGCTRNPRQQTDTLSPDKAAEYALLSQQDRGTRDVLCRNTHVICAIATISILGRVRQEHFFITVMRRHKRESQTQL